MDDKFRLVELFLIYEGLLTDKQRLYFRSYALDDLSLQEVADNYKVSRNAVHNMIKGVVKALNKYEDTLKLYVKKNKIIKLLDKEKSNLKDEIMNIL